MMSTMLTMMTWWQEASQTIDRMEYLFYLVSWDTSKCCAVVWTLVASARPACGLTQNGEMTEYWAVVAVVWVLASGGSLILGPSRTIPCLPIYACRHGTLNFLSALMKLLIIFSFVVTPLPYHCSKTMIHIPLYIAIKYFICLYCQVTTCILPDSGRKMKIENEDK